MDRKMILLFLVTTVHITTACLQGVPDITSIGNPNSTPTGIQGIVLSSSFSCEGRVTGWTACFASDPRIVHYNMQFYVWRPGNNGCYELLGTNVLPTTAPNSNVQFDVFDTYCIKVQVPRDQQIIFRPNDYIGFFIAINEQVPAGSGGLLLDVNTLGSIALGSGPCFGIFTQFSGPLAVILGAPLLSALVDDIAEGDTGPISAVQDPPASTSQTYNISSASSTEPVSIVHTLPFHTQSPAQTRTFHTQSQAQMSTSSTLTLTQTSTAYTQSSTHISTEVTTAIQILSSGSHTVQANASTAMSSETISEFPRLSSSTSTCTLRPTTPVISTDEAEKTRHRSNALAPATTYSLVAVGIILTIASTIAAIAAIFCIRKCKCKKQTSRRNHGPTRVASDFIYNSTYERYMDHAGLMTNLRRESTQYHSHWSLTHCDNSDSICYSYPSLEMVEMDNIYNTQGRDGTGNSRATDTPQTQTSTWLYEGKEVCPRNLVIPNPFQGNRKDGGPQGSKHTARQTSSKRASATGNSHLDHSQRGKGDKGYTCLYDNPVFKRKQAESDRSAVSVYYSKPIKQVGPPSILLSSNEAYASTNPTSFLLSENEAYKSGQAGGASGENAYGTSTDSVYYTRPTGISSEEEDEFGVSSNLAYGQPT